MVELTYSLDSLFGSLSDPTRRDILSRVADKELSISEIAGSYDMSFAAISKHLKVLEKAKLIIKRRNGNEQLVSLVPEAMKSVDEYLKQYQKFWDERFDELDKVLDQEMRNLSKEERNE